LAQFRGCLGSTLCGWLLSATPCTQGLQSVGQLTGLRDLRIGCNEDMKESILRRLTLLQQLTNLSVGRLNTKFVNLTCKVRFVAKI
jgi:hypothetical protein